MLSDISGMNIDIAYPIGAMPFFNFREELLRINQKLTGSRFMKNILCIGGLARDVNNTDLTRLSEYLAMFEKDFNLAVKDVLSSETVIDRFETTGYVHKELVRHLNLSGPIAKACGYTRDVRITHPYLLYKDIIPKIFINGTCDVMGRFLVKCADIRESVRLINKCILDIPKKGTILGRSIIRDGYGLSVVESARGQNLQWIYIKNGKISRYKIRTASFCNWQAIEHAVLKNIVPDFPLINKSFNLSYEGTDL